MRTKTDAITKDGWHPDDFDVKYWEAKDGTGTRRIDRSSVHIQKMVKYLQATHVLPSKPYLLDIGCGPGHLVKELRDIGWPADGCEFSPTARALGLKRFNVAIGPCDLRIRNGICFGDDIYDFAFSSGVFTMIPEQFLDICFAEVRRVIKPDGILHVNLINPTKNAQVDHLTALSNMEWRNAILKAGFEDVTSLAPPPRYGIGVNKEFTGLFAKRL